MVMEGEGEGTRTNSGPVLCIPLISIVEGKKTKGGHLSCSLWSGLSEGKPLALKVN